MQNFTDEQIGQMYDDLPEDLQEAIFSVETTRIVTELGKKYALAIDKIGDLANETGMVMLGVAHPKDFVANLEMRLEVDKNKAQAIAGDINDLVFRPVRDSLQKINLLRKGEDILATNGRISSAEISPLATSETRGEILKEIEKDHPRDQTTEVLKGEIAPFDAKLKEEVFKSETEEKHYEESSLNPPAQFAPEKPKGYQGNDPYRETTE